MAVSLTERTVVIIGGGSGLGFQVARRCVAAGARVVIGSRNEERLLRAARELGPSVAHDTLDVGDEASVEAFFDRVDVVHHLFSTAGDYVHGPIRELSLSEARTAIDQKFWGQYVAVKCALPRMAQDGSIVLISGADGVMPTAPTPAYVACNSAIEGLARGLAVDLSPIRVNAVSPGMMDGNFFATRKSPAVRAESIERYSARTALGRVGTEDEVAEGVMFLFTNTFVNGTTLAVDGGFTFR